MSSLSSASPPRPLKAPQLHTIRSLTGADVYPPSSSTSPVVTPEKRYSRQNILIFRSATGEERRLSSLAQQTHQSSSPLQHPVLKPRISSVTDSSEPDHDQSPNVSLPDFPSPPPAPLYRDDDADSIYSHASAINLEDLDDQHLSDFPPSPYHPQTSAPFANSFAKARQAKHRNALVLARPEVQPHNRSICLIERCVHALSEALDMNLLFATIAVDKFHAFSSLYTNDERQVIAHLLKEASARLRNEAPTPWRSPIRSSKRIVINASSPQNRSANQVANLFRSRFTHDNPETMSADTLVRSVVFGSHVIPGVQSAESILLRMAGEYQRDVINRKASRAERIDVPLSFALTLTGALATFARLECHASYRRYRCRSASTRRSSPRALIMVKTRYDGHRLSFAVTLHGESPCTVLFRRPRIFSLRKIDDYATLVTEAKDILTQFGREITGHNNSY